MFSKIYILYISLYIYVYTKVFLLHMINGWERTTIKKDREIGKHKLNEMGTLNMK